MKYKNFAVSPNMHAHMTLIIFKGILYDVSSLDSCGIAPVYYTRTLTEFFSLSNTFFQVSNILTAIEQFKHIKTKLTLSSEHIFRFGKSTIFDNGSDVQKAHYIKTKSDHESVYSFITD